MAESPEVVRELMTRYEVFITTAAMDVPCSFSPKFEWLQKHFPFIPPSNVVFCGDKSIVSADYLIDDDPRHFARFSGEGILYTAPHNVHETAYKRVNDWGEIRRLFLGLICPTPRISKPASRMPCTICSRMALASSLVRVWSYAPTSR